VWGNDVENIEVMPLGTAGDEWIVNFFRGGKEQAHVLMKSRDLKTWSEAKPNMLLSKDFRAGERVVTTETTLMEILRGK
jgi:hypothetical protein